MKPEVKMNCVTENELSLVSLVKMNCVIENESSLVSLDVLPKSKVPDIEEIVHDELEDLAIIYCFMSTETEGQKYHIIMIPNDTLDAIGYTEDQIKKQAVANTINKQPMHVSSIGSFIASMYKLDPQGFRCMSLPYLITSLEQKCLCIRSSLNTPRQLLAVATIFFRHLSMSLFFSLMTAHRP